MHEGKKHAEKASTFLKCRFWNATFYDTANSGQNVGFRSFLSSAILCYSNYHMNYDTDV